VHPFILGLLPRQAIVENILVLLWVVVICVVPEPVPLGGSLGVEVQNVVVAVNAVIAASLVS
jgi:hypothetical protein